MGIRNTVCDNEPKFIAFVEKCDYLSLAVLFQYWCIFAHQSIMELAKFVVVSVTESSAKRQKHKSGRSD
jgi:hypothetical protein